MYCVIKIKMYLYIIIITKAAADSIKNGKNKMTTGTTVYSKMNGEGVIISIEGTKAVVNFNGVEKTMMISLLKETKPATKVKSYMKKEKADVYTFNSIVNLIKGSAQDRGSMFAFGSEDVFVQIEKAADKAGHFAGKIINDARNGKFISDKQACVVAYFAKNNGFINA